MHGIGKSWCNDCELTMGSSICLNTTSKSRPIVAFPTNHSLLLPLSEERRTSKPISSSLRLEVSRSEGRDLLLYALLPLVVGEFWLVVLLRGVAVSLLVGIGALFWLCFGRLADLLVRLGVDVFHVLGADIIGQVLGKLLLESVQRRLATKVARREVD